MTGPVRLKLYKGNVAVVGRESPYSLYDQDLVTFEEGEVAYDQRDAAGFIRLNALRLRTLWGSGGRNSAGQIVRQFARGNYSACMPLARRPQGRASRRGVARVSRFRIFTSTST